MNRFSSFGLRAGRRVAMGTDRLLGSNTKREQAVQVAGQEEHPASTHRLVRYVVLHQMVCMGPLLLLLVWYGLGIGLVLWCVLYALTRFVETKR